MLLNIGVPDPDIAINPNSIHYIMYVWVSDLKYIIMSQFILFSLTATGEGNMTCERTINYRENAFCEFVSYGRVDVSGSSANWNFFF